MPFFELIGVVFEPMIAYSREFRAVKCQKGTAFSRVSFKPKAEGVLAVDGYWFCLLAAGACDRPSHHLM